MNITGLSGRWLGFYGAFLYNKMYGCFGGPEKKKTDRNKKVAV